MTMERELIRLQTNPKDWHLRCTLASTYYEQRSYELAASLMRAAPTIPEDEQSVIFTATLIGAIDLDGAHEILDPFIKQNPASAPAHLLKAQFHERAGETRLASEHKTLAASLSALRPDGEDSAAGAPPPGLSVTVPSADENAPEHTIDFEIEDTNGSGPEEITPASPSASAESAPSESIPAQSMAPDSAAPEPPASQPPGDTDASEADPSPVAGKPAVEPAPPESHFTPIPLDAPQSAEEHHGDGDEAGRAFIVVEGEAVHAADKEPETATKLGAVSIAILVHVVIVLLLSLWAVSTPRPNPPQVVVSTVPSENDSQVESKSLTRMEQKTAASSAAAQPVVTTAALSNFALPNIDSPTNLALVGMSEGDAGFGMSMTGFGDVGNMGAIPPGMRSRCSMAARTKRLREGGGDIRAEKAVRDGLEFLTKKQNKDGSFGVDYPAAMTGLALLAYLGHCETPESARYGDSVVNATLYLIDRALKQDGKLTNGKKGHHEAYEHAIATYALAELYTMTKESGSDIPRLHSVLRKAVGHIIDGQSRDGGWAYGFAPQSSARGKEDMSVSGWQIQALKAAYNTGRDFPGLERTLDKALEDYIPSIQDSRGAFKYRPDQGSGKPTLTGAALLAMQIWKGKGSPEYKKGLKFLEKHYSNPSPGSYYYAPYYNTQAFYMHGGKEWTNYNKQFAPRLLDAQNADGSWTQPGAARHGGKDAQIMNTAWAILMLEVYYRYLPTTAKVEGLEKR